MRNGQQHHTNNHKRMRGRNRRGGGGGHNPLTRVYESNGPDVKIRGTAHHVAEKYLQLARDAQSGGDPVSAESYLQHAEHYFRLIAAAQQQLAQNNPNYQQQPIQRSDQESGDDEDGDESDGGDQRFNSPVQYQEQPQQQQPQHNAPRPQPQNAPQPSIPDNGLPAFITGGVPQANVSGSENELGEQRNNRFNRNRGRNRFRPRNEGGDNREQGQAQPAESAPVKADPAE
jgi:DNA primase